MKVVQFHEHGPRDVLRYEDSAEPELGPDDVLVRVRACGVNRSDVDHRQWGSRMNFPMPWRVGHEVAGEVAAIGRDVDGFTEGQRVWVLHQYACQTCEYCTRGKDNLCLNTVIWGYQRLGCYAEYIAAPAKAVFPLSDSVSFEEGAAGQVGFATAWHMLLNRAGLQAGETVLVSAAGGGVGLGALQIAKLAGATVIATAGSDVKLAAARDEGADLVINHYDEDITARVREYTDDRGVDVVVEHVGGNQFNACLAALRRDGRLVSVGAHSGQVVDLDLYPLFREEWSVIGCRTATTREIVHVMELIGEGRLRPRLYTALELADAAEGHRILEEHENFGTVVLVP